MILTRGELISEAKTIAREVGADSKLTNKFLWSIINKHTPWLIRRESDKLKLSKFDYLYQPLKCLTVQEAPVIDPCCGIKNKCTVFRTCKPIPELYEDTHGVIINSVTSIDNSTEFTRIKIEDYRRKLEDPNSRFDKGHYYFFSEGHLYFPKSTIRKIMVIGHFKQKVYSDCDPDTTECVSLLDQPSYIPDYLRAELMEYVKKDLLTRKQIPEDDAIDKNQNRI